MRARVALLIIVGGLLSVAAVAVPLLADVARPLQIATAVTLGVLWAVAGFAAMRMMRPLGELAAIAHDIERGKYSVPELATFPAIDETGQVASALRALTARLQEVDSRDRQFMMSISHELRTPLTAIEGHAGALQDGVVDDPEMRDRSLAVIRREASRLERLVEDIIDLAKLRSNRFNTVVEQVMLDDLGDHLMAIFEDRVNQPDIEVVGDFEAIAFYSDGQRILQVLRNLVNNALRYAETRVLIRGERVRNSIRLSVANDGEPIPTETAERIFEPFFGQKREGGMGLGLAISRELAWALGGNLRLVPSDTGAIFELSLPLEPPGSGR